MAQATGVPNFVEAKVEYSTDGSAWTDISGYCAGVSTEGGDRQTGEGYTFDGDEPIVGVGKKTPTIVEIRVMYTETDEDPFDKAFEAFDASPPTQFQIRWWPTEGDAAGEFGYYTAADSRVINRPLPQGTPEDAGPIEITVRVRTSNVVRTVAT